jgi:hypothetical protein
MHSFLSTYERRTLACCFDRSRIDLYDYIISTYDDNKGKNK